MGLDYRTKVILGLDNVDNTSDIDKPVSTPQQTAINNAVSGKQNVLTSQQLYALKMNILNNM